MPQVAASHYKAIISDFDGTLTGPEFTISERVKNAVRRWQGSGGFFSIATGKPFNTIIDDSCKFLSLTDPVIVASGAEIVDPVTKEIIKAEYILEPDATAITKVLQEEGLLFEIQTHDTVYASDMKLADMLRHKTYEQIQDATYTHVLKIRLVTTDQDQEKIQHFLREHILRHFTEVGITQSDTPYSQGIDITAKNASKFTAAMYLTRFLHLTKEQVVGIGDSEADRNLFAASGYIAVMDSAPEEIQSLADLIVPDYKNDGVAVLIETLLSGS